MISFADVSRAIQIWIKEKDNWTCPDLGKDFGGMNTTRHWTQMISNLSTKIGCAFSFCQRGTLHPEVDMYNLFLRIQSSCEYTQFAVTIRSLLPNTTISATLDTFIPNTTISATLDTFFFNTGLSAMC